VPHYAPRTIYRYTDKLVQLGLVDRDERGGVPSVVNYRLAEPGAELYDLLESSTAVWLPRQDGGEITVQGWASLSMLAKLWDLGIIDELSRGGRSVTELSRGAHGLSYHQINRRINQLMTSGFVEKRPGNGTSKHFQLTPKARRGLSLVAAIGRWRERHLEEDTGGALTQDEMTTILRAALPLVELPSHSERHLMLAIEGDAGSCETIGTVIAPCGDVSFDEADDDEAAACARGSVAAWLEVLLDGSLERIDGGGDETVDALLTGLHAPAR
jgi:DNA-binding HxlR family transcriptional regulator